ncbi:hypothetical protein [Virgibacillus sediminis]|uniref:Uncharacterized protein n=1 Tax=Virgibacillus sediminis TaxID=202260 RepID=A0ABV7A5V7_9BACI
MSENVHANKEQIKDKQKEHSDLTEEQERDMDILELPPRREVHGSGKSRTRWKMSAPLIRLIVVILLILVLSAGLFWAEGEGII